MILYYHLTTKWSGLGDSTELSRMGLSHVHQNSHEGESRDKHVTIYYINSHKGVFNYNPSLLHKSKLFRVYKYIGNKTKREKVAL
jgi:hypothetical protein